MENIPGSFQEEDHEELLTLSLSIGPSPPPQNRNVQSLPPPPPPPPPPIQSGAATSSSSRKRRAAERIGAVKSDSIPEPYDWASTRRAVVLPVKQLLDGGVREVSGQMQCKKCYGEFKIVYDLQQKFEEVAAFVKQNKEHMQGRAPDAWMKPAQLDCVLCKCTNCCRPVMAERKRSVNWVFLMLGQMVGFCRVHELKYFCEHNNMNLRAPVHKDRLLYLTCLGICKQLDPDGPFDP